MAALSKVLLKLEHTLKNACCENAKVFRFQRVFYIRLFIFVQLIVEFNYSFIFVFSRASWHSSAGLCWLPHTNGITALLQGGCLLISTITVAYNTVVRVVIHVI